MASPRKRTIRRDAKYRRRVFFYGVLLSTFLFLLSLLRPTFFDFLNNRVYDKLLSANLGQPSPLPVIVDIDEKSLQQYGQWPWPRYRVAHLLDKLRGLGALTIGLDMMFAESDRTSLAALRKELLRDFGTNVRFERVPRDLWDSDKRLAEALSHGKVVLGYQFLFEEDSRSGDCLLQALRVNRVGRFEEEKSSALFVDAKGVSCNLKELSQAAASSGFFNVSIDGDGVLRKVPLVIRYQGRFYPSLALATLMQSFGVSDILLERDENHAEFISLNKIRIPLTARGDMLLRFRGKSKSFDYISAADILGDRIARERIEGKIVFVGTSASGMKEFKSTPFDPIFPGVEIHATVVDNILKRDFLYRPIWAPGLESMLAFFTGIVSTVILVWTGAAWSSLLLGGIGAALWEASAWIFRSQGIFLSPALPLIVLGCNFSLLTFFKFWHEEKRARERIRELARVQEATIESMCSLTETRDPETGGHIKRTQHYVRLLAEHLKNQPKFRALLDDETIDLLCRSAPLHDIGKVGVSDKILLNPGKLTEQEFEEMKKHTIFGRDVILSAERKLGETSFLRFAREIAYTHHERWDGTGYPEGLKGEEIPLSGRLMALADTYDALTSKRVYRSQVAHEEAVRIILESKGSQFDPAVVDAFLALEEDFRQIASRID